jgi:hypothetical protein
MKASLESYPGIMNPRRNKEEFANANENDYSEGDRHCASAAPSSRTMSVWKGSIFHESSRKIITSVALMRAAAVCPRFSCISLAERAVMIEVIC